MIIVATFILQAICTRHFARPRSERKPERRNSRDHKLKAITISFIGWGTIVRSLQYESQQQALTLVLSCISTHGSSFGKDLAYHHSRLRCVGETFGTCPL